MNDFVVSCGRYFWSPKIKPRDWIREADYEAFTSQHSLGRIYHCVGIEDNFIVLKSNRNESYRVNPEGFHQVPFTDFYIGDKVKVLNGSKAGMIAVIDMGWHAKREKIIYLLEIDGKRRTRHYWEENIEVYSARE